MLTDQWLSALYGVWDIIDTLSRVVIRMNKLIMKRICLANKCSEAFLY